MSPFLNINSFAILVFFFHCPKEKSYVFYFKDKYNQTEGEILKLKIQLANLNKEYEKSIKLENQLLQKEKAEEYEKILEEIKQRYIEMGDEAGEGGDKIKEALEEEIKLSGEVIQLQKERDKWYNFLKTKFKKAFDYVMNNPKWRVSLQTHKYLNIP